MPPNADPPPLNPNHPEDPPVVVVQDEFNDSWDVQWKSFHALLSEPAYGAPRVFDLFTLMAVTLAFGLLFALLKALDAIPEVFFGVTVFVTLVAIGQMLFFGGNSPRLASLVGGPIALAVTLASINIWYSRWEVVGTVCALPLGVAAGYLAGGMVAGVFLIADLLREIFSKHKKEEVENNFWDDED